jgi:pectin methylesterase-like acyl-CoA thioesterase
MRADPLARLLETLVFSVFVGSAGCADADSDGNPGSGGTSSGVGGAQGGVGGAGLAGTGGVAGLAAGGVGAGGMAGSGAGGSPEGGSSGSNTGAGAAGSPGGASGAGGADGSAGEGAGTSGAAGSGAGSGGGAGAGGTAGTGGQQMNLPTGVTAMYPGPNATGVCRDTQLRITFPGPPTLGSSGHLRVNDAGGTAVATVDMAAMTITDTINGQMYSLPRRAFVDGNEAVIYLPRNALAYGETYSVTIENGAINRPNSGGAFTIADDTTWRFTLAPAGPSNLSALSVDLRGGQFCSVLGALEALPANNDTATTITIAAGTYHEVINMSGKNKVTLHGASRTGTVISGVNNNDMNPSTRGRALLGFDNLSDLVIENLTIHNLTPQGGSQAEALRLGSCNHCIIRDADIKSLQDTLLWGGTVYAKNCLIAGNVDYIWGSGAAYFDQCEIRTVGRSGYLVQARNANPGYGYVFVDSKLTSDPPNLTGDVLARIDVSAYPDSHVAYIDCEMGPHISAAGWTITGGSAGSGLRFWEYQSKAPGGALIDTSGRHSGSTQITAQQAAMMRDKATVLGGWNPN